jgi:hypothetical protein
MGQHNRSGEKLIGVYIDCSSDRLYLNRSYCGDLRPFWRLGKLDRQSFSKSRGKRPYFHLMRFVIR